MRELYWDSSNEEICAKVATYDDGVGVVMLYADGETGCGSPDWYDFFARDELPLTLESIAEATKEYNDEQDIKRQEDLEDGKLTELEPDRYEESWFRRHGREC